MADEPTRTLAPKIDPEFAAIFPKLSEEETKILRQKIQREGMTQPLIVWGDPDSAKHEPNILIDGHNRLGICRDMQIKYQVKYIQFRDGRNQVITDPDLARTAAERWIYLNQLGRRNLSPDRATYFLGKYWLSVKGKRGEKPTSAKSADVPAETGTLTAKEVAAQAGVSERTVHNAGTFAAAVDAMPTEEKEKVLAGKGPSRAEVVQGMGWRQTPIKEVITHPASNIVFAERQLKTVGEVYDALINKSIPTETADGARLCIPERAQDHLQKDIERFIQESTATPAKAPRKAKSDNGAVDLVWTNWHNAVGSVTRQVDNLFRAHDKLNCPRHTDWLHTWGVLQQEFRDMYTELTGKQAPPISGGNSGQA
jgi:hypothetical protein